MALLVADDELEQVPDILVGSVRSGCLIGREHLCFARDVSRDEGEKLLVELTEPGPVVLGFLAGAPRDRFDARSTDSHRFPPSASQPSRVSFGRYSLPWIGPNVPYWTPV